MSNSIPLELKQAIQEQLEIASLASLTKSREEIAIRYRDLVQRNALKAAGEAFIANQGHRLAYMAARMPATYAAVSAVLAEFRRRLPTLKVESLLDLGSGPGTALWAFTECIPELNNVTLMEQDEELISLGQKLFRKERPAAKWIHANIANLAEMPLQDCVVMSYSLGELQADIQAKLVDFCWASAGKVVILIEPGTPYGFETILRARQQLIDAGASIIAPCPHAAQCPLAAIGDWCHFSVRLERTVEHRLLKEGTLGYEDEKYSYLIVAKEPCKPYSNRILRHPQKRSGHIHFTLCSAEGLQQRIVSKREGQFYKDAKKLEWGGVLQ